ncbi:MAG: hypothetical protein CMI63_20275 [Parvularcula sp.]|nr:hypothetical protein [Parvularcula sp.]
MRKARPPRTAGALFVDTRMIVRVIWFVCHPGKRQRRLSGIYLHAFGGEDPGSALRPGFQSEKL